MHAQKILSSLNIIPEFAEPKSDVAQLIQAIFAGDEARAKGLLKKGFFEYKQNLDSNVVD